MEIKAIKRVHAKSGQDCIMECAVLQNTSCRSANYNKTATSGEEENCELLQIVDSEKYAESLKKNKNFDHYIILSLKTVSIQSEFVQTLYMQSLSKLDQLSDGFILKLIHLMFILLFIFSNHEFVCVVYRQGCAGVLKRTTNEQRLIGPRSSDGWIKIQVVVLLIKHETFRSLLIFFPKSFGVKKFSDIPFFSHFRINVCNLLNCSVIFS